jgi:hypothetical protein
MTWENRRDATIQNRGTRDRRKRGLYYGENDDLEVELTVRRKDGRDITNSQAEEAYKLFVSQLPDRGSSVREPRRI